MDKAIVCRDLEALRRMAPKPQLMLDCSRMAWLEGLKTLVASGGDVNASWRGYRPLHAVIQEEPHATSTCGAERIDCLKWLLSRGADPELPGAWPPARALLIAALSGAPEFVRALLQNKARQDIFTHAALGNTTDLKRMLKKSPDLALARDGGGLTALQCAAGSRMPQQDKTYECAQILIEAGADVRARTKSWSHEIDAVYLAANSSNLKIFELLLESGADATAALPGAVWQSTSGCAEIALRYGARIDEACDEGKPVLNQMVRWGRMKQAFWLLSQGASPNVADDRGWTALHQAASRGNERVVRALLDAGADRTMKDKQGNRPVDLTAKENLRELLLVRRVKGRTGE